MFTSRFIGRLKIGTILSYVSEEDIFRYYIPTFKKIGEPFSSALRKDNNPSCCITDKYSRLKYTDFGTGDRFNCFTYVANLKQCSFKEALETICRDLDLFKGKPTKIVQKSLKTSINTQIKETEIKIKQRDFTKVDEEYWNQYHIPLSNLKDRVKAVEHYWINGYMVYTHTDLDPAYSYECHRGKRKIVRPYCSDKRRKWVSNLTNNKVYGMEYLDYRKNTCIITSSLKDVLIWELIGVNAVWPQSETALIREQDIKELKKNFKTLIINFNTDNMGKKYSKINAEKYDLKEFFIPEIYKTKDPSDFVKEYGLKTLIKLYGDKINRGI